MSCLNNPHSFCFAGYDLRCSHPWNRPVKQKWKIVVSEVDDAWHMPVTFAALFDSWRLGSLREVSRSLLRAAYQVRVRAASGAYVRAGCKFQTPVVEVISSCWALANYLFDADDAHLKKSHATLWMVWMTSYLVSRRSRRVDWGGFVHVESARPKQILS